MGVGSMPHLADCLPLIHGTMGLFPSMTYKVGIVGKYL